MFNLEQNKYILMSKLRFLHNIIMHAVVLF